MLCGVACGEFRCSDGSVVIGHELGRVLEYGETVGGVFFGNEEGIDFLGKECVYGSVQCIGDVVHILL